MTQTTVTITGTEANQFTVNTTSLSPFSNVVVTDYAPGQLETVTVTLSAASHGALSSLDSGSYDASSGVYTVTGTAADVSASLDNLVFTPTAADQLVKTNFAINVVDSAGDRAFNHSTSVTSAQPETIATNGVTTLASLGNPNNVNDTYMVQNINGSVVAYLTLDGSPVLVNQFPAGWTPVGAKQTGTGYEVAWVSTAGMYVVWNVASNGAYTGNATAVLSATSTELAGVEANFGELANAGVFSGPTLASSGPTPAAPTTIAVSATTALALVGDVYELNPASGGTGPLLEVNGSVVVQGQFGAAGWTPVAATQSGNGYEVAFSGANGYVVWNVNSSGDFTSAATGVVAAGSSTIEAVEANFGETFTGAGTPATPTTIAANSTTTLASVGNLFELLPTAGGTGPLLELNGSAVNQGQFGAAGWTPVGAVQTADGYEVAFSGTAGYVVWDVSSSGDFTGDATGVVAAGSATIEAVEANFGETFTGAGTAATPVTIATNGATTLASVGNLYELNPATGGGVGPLLELNGSALEAGQFGAAGWTPVGAVETATGYEVAFRGTSGYVVWNTDSAGDFTSDATGILSGTSYALEQLELTFSEDLNGDGTIGPTTVATGTNGALDQVANQFELIPTGGGTGPWLELNGSVVTQGQFGAAGWTPVGALQTGTGWEVAFSGTNGYVVWNVNSFGEFTGNATGVVAAGSATIEAVEANFGENFGAGTSATPSPIANNGTTTLDAVGNLFELVPTAGGTGPLLELNGSVVAAGQFGAAGWTPVAALWTGDGYEVAFSGASGYVVWNVNSSGDFTNDATGVAPAGSATIEAVEANFGENFGAGTPATPSPIANNGTTTLDAVGNLFELIPTAGGTGPLLELNGSAVQAGQFGAAGWTPVAAKQTGDGYEVAFSGANGEYVVWNVNTQGDFTSNATGVVSAGSATIEGVEANFGENFGAGTPATPTPIAINGTNNGMLDLVGNLYELNPSGGGPLLELNGSAVAAGSLGSWTPIGAEQTSTGYEVAFSQPGADGVTQYTVWNTDSAGDYTSSALGVVSGPSFPLEDLDPATDSNGATGFGENLNGAPSLSTLLDTSTALNGTLNLSSQTQNVTVDLGVNTASATGSGLDISSSSSSPTFSGTPFAITLNSSAHEIVEYGLSPSSGIETIANFVLGQDELNIGLRGGASSLEFADMTVNGAAAVGIFNSADPSHGVVLLNVGVSAHALQTDYTTTVGGTTGQGHALIGYPIA
jgi:hypothetical protein